VQTGFHEWEIGQFQLMVTSHFSARDIGWCCRFDWNTWQRSRSSAGTRNVSRFL